MEVDWKIIAQIASPVIAFFLGRFLERKPKIIAYYSNISAVTVKTNEPILVHIHSITIRNKGGMAATNIRVGHRIDLEGMNFSLYPSHKYEIVKFPNYEGSELVLSKLLPKETLTINYLYYPPLLFNQIHSHLKHDGGIGKVVDGMSLPTPSKIQLCIVYTLMGIGSIALAYLAVMLLKYFMVV